MCYRWLLGVPFEGAVDEHQLQPHHESKKSPAKAAGLRRYEKKDDQCNETIADDQEFTLERSSLQATCCP